MIRCPAFGSLSAGGRVTVPFAKQFWGDHYGNFTDAYGVQWAITAIARADTYASDVPSDPSTIRS